MYFVFSVNAEVMVDEKLKMKNDIRKMENEK
jgi:hypothetical protein